MYGTLGGRGGDGMGDAGGCGGSKRGLSVSIPRPGPPDPHGATAQFFVNVRNNDALNYTSKTERGWGYTVFGKVAKGHGVINKIKAVQTGGKNGFDDVPVAPVTIIKAEVVDE